MEDRAGGSVLEDASGMLAGVSRELGDTRAAVLASDPIEGLSKEEKIALISSGARKVHQERAEQAERAAREAAQAEVRQLREKLQQMETLQQEAQDMAEGVPPAVPCKPEPQPGQGED